MDTTLLLTLAAVFGSVAILSGFVLSRWLLGATPSQRRLAALEGSTSALVTTPLLVNQPDLLGQRLATLVPRSPKDVSRLRQRLLRAGYSSDRAFAIYMGAEMLLPPIFAAVAFFLLPIPKYWLVWVFAAAFGFVLPSVILGRRVARRQRLIRNALPDALDLMIVCLESGSSIDQAVIKVSDELALAYPDLAEELRMLVTETRAGKPRMEAFRNLADRTAVADVRALVAMLIQTDRFGTSVAQALRTHAEVSRTKRRQRAEEAAAKIGVKLAFPLVFCLFPAFFIVTLGPAILQFVHVFFAQIAGQ